MAIDNNPEGTVDEEDLSATADGLSDDAFDDDEASDQEQSSAAAETAEDEGASEGADEADEEGAEPEKAEAEPEKPGEQPARIRLKDGSEVTLDEIDASYLRQSDYTRKTQEVARERETIQASRANLTRYESQTKEVLDVALALIAKTMPKKPDPSLIHTDAIKFVAEKEAYEAAQMELQQLVGTRRQLEARDAQSRQEAQRSQQVDLGKALDQELTKLGQKAPELRSDEARTAMLREAADLGSKHYELTPEEVGGIQDHRFILILKDAIAFRKLQDAKPAAVAKVKAAPPIRSAVRQAPGTRAASRDAKAWDRLKREGSIEAAADALPDGLFD